jgi:hypothetical protein
MDTFNAATEFYHKTVFRRIFGQLNVQVFGRRKLTFIPPSLDEQSAKHRTDAHAKQREDKCLEDQACNGFFSRK